MEPTVHAWAKLHADHPMPLLSRTRVIGEQVMISRVELSKGCFVPTHGHANEQVAVVLSGALKFGLGDEGPGQRFQTVRAGEVIHLPSHCPHSAEALEDTVVLDVFSPPSATTGIDRHGRRGARRCGRSAARGGLLRRLRRCRRSRSPRRRRG